jgi:Fuc2NAc and GlcNAc transferase
MAGLLTFLCVLSGIASWGITRLVERHARKLGLIQLPNHRSSHTTPTPRGGGLGIALGGLIAVFAMACLGAPYFWHLALVLIIVATIGFADDIFDLGAPPRLLAQFVALGILLLQIAPFPELVLPNGATIQGVALIVLVLFTGVWWVNLFNFMDGIDGIAASQAVAILLAADILWITQDSTAINELIWWLPIAISAASAGFLVRNFPPAKIFMGDSGAYFLSSSIFCFAIFTISIGQISYNSWIILVSIFVSDASTTLVRRILKGHKPSEPHRTHCYQILSRRFQNHATPTFLFTAATAVWSAPLAFWAQSDPNNWWIVMIAYLPQVAIVTFVSTKVDDQKSPLNL